MLEYEIVHNVDESRFEAHIDDQTAVIDYTEEAGVLSVTHTGVPKSLEGRGIAGELTKTLLEYARANGYKIYPICPYTKTYIERHQEKYGNLVV